MEGAMEKIAREYQEKGMEKGRAEERSDIILKLLNFGRMTLEEIASMLGLPLSEVQSYVKQG